MQSVDIGRFATLASADAVQLRPSPNFVGVKSVGSRRTKRFLVLGACILALAAGCSSGSTDAIRNEGEQTAAVGVSAVQRAIWNDADIERYSLTYTSVCADPGWYTVAPVRLEVNSELVEILGGPSPLEIATVDRLFELIEEAQAADAAKVLIEYGEYGQPTKVVIRYHESTVDDDLCIDVSLFEALDDFVGVVDGPVLSVTGPGGVGEDAMIEGLLVLEDGCLYVRNEEWGPSALLWPFGTAWDTEAQAVVGTDGSRAVVGQRLVTGGGYGTVEHYQEQRRLIGEGLAEAAIACTSGEVESIALVSNAFMSE